MLKALQSLESLESAVSAASSGLVITDIGLPDNPIVYANPAFHVMTGYDEASIVGRNCRFLQGAETDPSVVAALRGAIRAGEEFDDELLNYRRDGTPFWNRLAVSPIRGADGAISGFVGVQSDVTRRVLAESENQRLVDDLGAFASIVAHDLQGPLRRIRSFLELIKSEHGEVFDEEAAQWFEHAMQGADRAAATVRETLEIARAGRGGLAPQEVALDAVLDRVLDEQEAEIRAAAAEIDRRPLPVLLGHESEFHHLFANLISNALKYREPSRPCRIRVVYERTAREDRIRIEDNGIGVPESAVVSVFRAFRRGPNVRHRAGSGVGLAVVKRIVEALGGRIALTSEVGVGSCFEIVLPRRAESHAL